MVGFAAQCTAGAAREFEPVRVWYCGRRIGLAASETFVEGIHRICGGRQLRGTPSAGVFCASAADWRSERSVASSADFQDPSKPVLECSRRRAGSTGFSTSRWWSALPSSIQWWSSSSRTSPRTCRRPAASSPASDPVAQPPST